MIKIAKFMAPRDQLKTMLLFASMIIYLGSPDYLAGLRAVEYNFEVGRNFLQNLMWVSRSRAEQKLLRFDTPVFVSGRRWPHMPVSVSVF